ncbi:MAG: ArsR family transcriptional regulator [Candidatus Thermoplasmatota archaeon]
MDRSVLAPLTRPRRIAASLVVFLALGGFAGVVVGAAGANDQTPLDGVPLASFHLADPMAGDKGVYEVRPAPGKSLEQALDRTFDRRLAFHWLEDQVLRNETGTAQWANLVRMNETSVATGELDYRDNVVALLPGSLGSFAVLHADARPPEQEDGTTTYVVQSQLSFVAWERALPCAFRNAFQGQVIQVPSADLPTQPTCAQGPGLRNDVERVLVASEAAASNGTAFLRARVMDRGVGLFGSLPVLDLLFRDDIPYPLQIHEDGEPFLYVLTSFERGSTPVRHQPEHVAGPPPPLAFAPAQPWGPDDTGVEHPFPANVAYVQARDDTTFDDMRLFLASHPDAYVARMHYGNLYSDGRDGEWQYWSFYLTDGVETVDVHVRRIEKAPDDRASALAPVFDLLGSTAPSTFEYDYSASEVEDARDKYPLPNALPELPTVASMLRQWQGYASMSFADKPANDWSIYIECARHTDSDEPDCTQADIHVSAGHAWYTRHYPDSVQGTAGEPIDGYVSSTLTWVSVVGRDDLTFAHPYYYSDQRVDWREPGQPPPVESSPSFAGPGRSSLVPLSVGSLWVFPSAAESAAISVGALLAAVAYWLWPTIKMGAIGLFSRVQKDRLLDHPFRQQLAQRIEAEPGIHHNALVRELGRGNGATEHHLDKLVEGRLILRHRGTGFTCYFPLGTDRRAMAAAPAAKADGARRILQALQTGPSGVRAIAQATGLAPSTVSHHLERLRQVGLVTGDGRSGYSAASPTGARAAA